MKISLLHLLICYLLIPSVSKARMVSHLGDAGKGSLRWALENASEGERITFSSEIIGRTIVLNSPIKVPEKTISLSGPNRQIIISAPYSSVFSNLSGSNFSLTGISFRDSESILSSVSRSTVAIENCSFRNIQDCFPKVGGSLDVQRSSFYKNKNILNRGGKEVRFYKCTFEANKGILLGGDRVASVLLDNCHFEGNEAPASKGLISLKSVGNTATHWQIYNCRFIKNRMPKGAIIQSTIQGGKNHKIDIKGNIISGNEGKVLFGILENDATLMFNEQGGIQAMGTCEDSSKGAKPDKDAVLLGQESFPNFCEGMAILRRSSQAKFVHMVEGRPIQSSEEEDCCRRRIRIF